VDTKLLYMDNIYLRECTAKVVSANIKGIGKRAGTEIVLDRTVMLPHTKDGGDKGTIKGRAGELIVKDVAKNPGNGKILHIGKMIGDLQPGDDVLVSIDWDIRYIHMRKHDMFHLLYSCARSIVGEDFLALSKISIGTSYGDWLDVPEMYKTLVMEAAEMANRVVPENRPITIETLPREDALKRCGEFFEKIIPNSAEELRLVTIQGFKPDPCIGPHVNATDEIGRFEVGIIEKINSNLRIYADLV
jgi:misacylated tRNA(Ala) deacylase